MKLAKVVTTFNLQSKWAELFKAVDLDNNGFIDYEEWITASIDKKKYLTADNIRKAFKLLGGTDKGYLDTKTFRSKMP